MVNIKTPFSRSNQQQQRRQEQPQEQKSKNNHRCQHNNDENKYLLFVSDVDYYDVDDDDGDDDDVECQSGDLVMTPFWHQLSRSRSYPDPNWINPFSIGQTTAKEVL